MSPILPIMRVDPNVPIEDTVGAIANGEGRLYPLYRAF
jgi:hypothetical protein